MKKSLSRRVLEFLRECSGASIKEISEVTGAPPGKVRAILYELRSKGHVERVGNTYIITERGRRFLEYVGHAESQPAQLIGSEEAHSEVRAFAGNGVIHERADKVGTEGVSAEGRPTTESYKNLESSITELSQRLVELERRISMLEKAVKDLEKAMEATQKKKQSELLLESPVVPYSYASSKLGSLLEKYLAESRLVRVGSLVVDSQFYSEFRSKFPIKISDLDKLAPHERALLEEMRKEALVILHAGREYRLVD